ncbi:MAG TPA: M20/M25/M40 family metallo-hydrolase [Candidatus Angelobacter sp.]
MRDYIVRTLAESGLTADVQRATAVGQTRPVAASTENIVARLPGSGGGKSVLLVAHYDSVPISFGASDDGAGVAVLLETARVLQSLPRLKRDVVFLFTDGEELGLLGAQAFVAEHPQAANAGVVMNFEARGTRGPAILFETSNQNGALMQGVSRTVRSPVANSLSYEIYKRLPNDTDFSVFKRAGYPGLNFAFIDEVVHYHTLMDSGQNLDPGSLQHEGDYAVDLARWFGDSLEDNLKSQGSVTYFDLLGMVLIRYSSSAGVVFLALTALLLVAAIVQGFKKSCMTVKGLLSGMVIMLLAVFAAAAVSFAAQYLVAMLGNGSRAVLAGEFYNSGTYVTAFAALGLGTAFLFWNAAARRLGPDNLAMSGLVLWFILLLVTSVVAPGAAYLLLWPLFLALVAWNVKLFKPRPGAVLLNLATVAAVILVAPMLHKIFTAFDLGSYLIVGVILTLLAALSVFQLTDGPARRSWLVPGALYVGGSALLLVALLFSPRFDRRHPRLDSAFYVSNQDTGSYTWASYDKAPDEWTSQLFHQPIQRQTLPELLPGSPRRLMQTPADPVAIAGPSMEILESKAVGSERQVHLRVLSPRHAPIILLFIPQETAVISSSVNGHDLHAASAAQGGWTMQYYGAPADGIDLMLKMRAAGPLSLRIADVSYGLPDAATATLKPRPDSSIPSPVGFNDTTVVVKTFSVQ